MDWPLHYLIALRNGLFFFRQRHICLYVYMYSDRRHRAFCILYWKRVSSNAVARGTSVLCPRDYCTLRILDCFALWPSAKRPRQFALANQSVQQRTCTPTQGPGSYFLLQTEDRFLGAEQFWAWLLTCNEPVVCTPPQYNVGKASLFR